MIFQNRDAFKIHMTLYALNHKFNYRNQRSTQYMIILKCSGLLCQWRVYAINMPDSYLYEIIRANLTHYRWEREGMRAKRVDQVLVSLEKWCVMITLSRFLTGRHDTPGRLHWILQRGHLWILRLCFRHIYSSWLLQTPQSIVVVETMYHESVGQCFKYLFFALGASVKGYEYMRKAVVVDGTHMKQIIQAVW